MSRRGFWLIALLALVLAVGTIGLVGCGGDEETTTTAAADTEDMILVEDGKLIAGSDTSYPPMEFMTGTTAEGFDVDLLTAIGEKLGLAVEFKTEIFDTLIPSLQAGGKFDVIASSMTITDERKEMIDFSDPYIDSNQSIAVMKSSGIESEEDLAGKKIGVQSGTTGEAWATENLTDSEITPFDNTTKAFSAMQAGIVDAIVNDLPVSAYIVAQDTTESMAIIEEIPTGEQYGFGVSKDNPGLLAAINQALADLKADGTYADIYEKWFGMAPPSN